MAKGASSLLSGMQKEFGADKIMMAADIPVGAPISTGSLALDFATGYGGFPSNRVVEICGKEGCGKTTLALLTMVNALKVATNRCAIILDVEHKMSPDWLCMVVGKDCMERILYLQPTSMEEATNMYRAALTTGEVCFAMLDSIGGAPTLRRNDDATVGHYGGNAQAVGEFSRSAVALSATLDCLTIGVNQTRSSMTQYSTLTTPGGHAWKHAVIMRIELVRGHDTQQETINGEKVPVGYTVHAKVRKNQAGAPGRTAMYWFYNVYTPEHGFGIDHLDEVVRLGVKTEVIRPAGGWYHHPAFADGKAHGLTKVVDLLRADDRLAETLVSEILARLNEYGQEIAPISDPDAPILEGELQL